MRPETLIALALWLIAYLLFTRSEIDLAWIVDRIYDVNRLLTDLLHHL